MSDHTIDGVTEVIGNRKVATHPRPGGGGGGAAVIFIRIFEQVVLLPQEKTWRCI